MTQTVYVNLKWIQISLRYLCLYVYLNLDVLKWLHIPHGKMQNLRNV